MASSKVKLWVSATCPYAARAWVSCNERLANNENVDFELRMVDLQNKPEDFNAMYASISPWGTETSSKVPIFEEEAEDGAGIKLIESGVITNYVADKFPLDGSSFTAEESAAARLFADTFEKTLGGLTMPIMKASGDADAIQAVAEKIQSSIGILNSYLLRISPEGPFVLENKFSVAEMMTAPFLQRLIPVAKHFVGVDVLAQCQEMKADRLLKWIEATLARESVSSIQVDDNQLIASYMKMMERIKAMSAVSPAK
eukprot:CAMPEP_0174960370 /NCGR_PEP_ID=MMETSP0004_2-20121128/3668_1 /TAXON_ID=420556 /ORGANISM="Ochromonas sp., Strain CCMP1393" /LENGTH=255 /DNA_ID=CAMNT_0016208739 /DNA_START=18 /DNA_END=785 /DNA_ORIENTATION=-